MAHLRSLIDDLVVGEDREVPRTVDLTPIGEALSRAWFTVKSEIDDSDADAVFQKEITSVSSVDGQIDDIGTDSPITEGHLYFLIPSDDTLLLTPEIYYYYDIKAMSASGAKIVLESGRLIAHYQITQDDS